MEEDIKAIQEYIEYDKEHRIVTVFDKKPLFRDRLENLLKRYKELEEENKELRKFADITLMRSKSKVAEVIKDSIFFEYIPISVIQNKIDELIEKENSVADGIKGLGQILDCRTQVKVLQELLEERNK